MTCQDAINKEDALKPNQYSEEAKIGWLRELDGIILQNIIMTHEHTEEQETLPEYDISTVLLVEAPYDAIYTAWLQVKIDYYVGEFARYNNSKVAFNDAMAEFERFYNRTHMPLGKHIKYF